MATTVLESNAISAFCESVAMMLAAGIQTDEAVSLLGESEEEDAFKHLCDTVYAYLISGSSLAEALQSSRAFPCHVIDMVSVGEAAGRLESTLRTLAVHYDEEHRLLKKMRSSLVYPTVLLCIMSALLGFTVAAILPAFVHGYESLSGNSALGSLNVASVALGIGWIALVVTVAATVLALLVVFALRSDDGRKRLIWLAEKLPPTRASIHRVVLSRFTSALSIYVASGIDTDTAMKEAVRMIGHRAISAQLEQARVAMMNPSASKNLAQALAESGAFEPVYARMLIIGARSGSTEEVLSRLSLMFFDDAVAGMDRLVEGVKPTLAVFLTGAMGATLVSVILPFVGIMGSIR